VSKRSRIIHRLVDGILIIEVKMKLIEATDTSQCTPASPFVPENLLCKNILEKVYG